MIETVSCGGVVFHRGKVLLLYKNQNGRYMGWALPKGGVEDAESYRQAALREVKEEARVSAKILRYIGKTNYTFKANSETISKTVYWYLMYTDSFFCQPQAEEYFADAGFYKKHEAIHLLKFYDEKQIITKAFSQYEKFHRKKIFY